MRNTVSEKRSLAIFINEKLNHKSYVSALVNEFPRPRCPTSIPFQWGFQCFAKVTAKSQETSSFQIGWTTR